MVCQKDTSFKCRFKYQIQCYEQKCENADILTLVCLLLKAETVEVACLSRLSFRLRTVPLSQLCPSRERKEIGEKNKSAPRKKREAPIYFFSPISFRSRDGQSWEKGAARSLFCRLPVFINEPTSYFRGAIELQRSHEHMMRPTRVYLPHVRRFTILAFCTDCVLWAVRLQYCICPTCKTSTVFWVLPVKSFFNQKNI